MREDVAHVGRLAEMATCTPRTARYALILAQDLAKRLREVLFMLIISARPLQEILIPCAAPHPGIWRSWPCKMLAASGYVVYHMLPTVSARWSWRAHLLRAQIRAAVPLMFAVAGVRWNRARRALGVDLATAEAQIEEQLHNLFVALSASNFDLDQVGDLMLEAAGSADAAKRNRAGSAVRQRAGAAFRNPS